MQWRHIRQNCFTSSSRQSQKKKTSTALKVAVLPRCPLTPQWAMMQILSRRSFEFGIHTLPFRFTTAFLSRSSLNSSCFCSVETCCSPLISSSQSRRTVHLQEDSLHSIEEPLESAVRCSALHLLSILREYQPIYWTLQGYVRSRTWTQTVCLPIGIACQLVASWNNCLSRLDRRHISHSMIGEEPQPFISQEKLTESFNCFHNRERFFLNHTPMLLRSVESSTEKCQRFVSLHQDIQVHWARFLRANLVIESVAIFLLNCSLLHLLVEFQIVISQSLTFCANPLKRLSDVLSQTRRLELLDNLRQST